VVKIEFQVRVVKDQVVKVQEASAHVASTSRKF